MDANEKLIKELEALIDLNSNLDEGGIPFVRENLILGLYDYLTYYKDHMLNPKLYKEIKKELDMQRKSLYEEFEIVEEEYDEIEHITSYVKTGRKFKRTKLVKKQR